MCVVDGVQVTKAAKHLRLHYIFRQIATDVMVCTVPFLAESAEALQPQGGHGPRVNAPIAEAAQGQGLVHLRRRVLQPHFVGFAVIGIGGAPAVNHHLDLHADMVEVIAPGVQPGLRAAHRRLPLLPRGDGGTQCLGNFDACLVRQFQSRIRLLEVLLDDRRLTLSTQRAVDDVVAGQFDVVFRDNAFQMGIRLHQLVPHAERHHVGAKQHVLALCVLLLSAEIGRGAGVLAHVRNLLHRDAHGLAQGVRASRHCNALNSQVFESLKSVAAAVVDEAVVREHLIELPRR
mmetsp:Transcript_36747/g.59932  ORF Transcript_36747/g.59932 Transcript_36747/m.59932 type:complete len:289 (-) Transcript_36747:993-1859(-)